MKILRCFGQSQYLKFLMEGFVISGFSKDLENNFQTTLGLLKLNEVGDIKWYTSLNPLDQAGKWLNDVVETLDGGFFSRRHGA